MFITTNNQTNLIGFKNICSFILIGAISISLSAYADSWTVTGSMANNREFHTATLLPNGKVLVTGGQYLSSAEVFDVTTGTWSNTGDMATARGYHTTATLLPNGKVLVVGGTNNGITYFNSAEVFVTGYWGHGMNSYAYYLLYVDGCSKVFLRVGFGGVYSNQEHDQQHVRAVFEGFADFLEKIEGKVKCMTIVDSMGVSNFKIITTDGRKIGKFPDQVYSEKKLRLDTGIPFAELTECVLDTKCFDGPEIDGIEC